MKRFLFLILGLLFIQCSGSSLSNLYQKYVVNDYLYWGNDHQLTWDDFQGKPPQKSVEATSDIHVYNPATIERANIFSSPKLTAICVLDKKNSWVRKKYKSENLLLYNQVIFNIYELYTRKLRDKFNQTDFSGNDYIKKFHRLTADINQHLINEVQTFRVKSDLGGNAEVVQKWNDYINSKLKGLKAFKSEKD